MILLIFWFTFKLFYNVYMIHKIPCIIHKSIHETKHKFFVYLKTKNGRQQTIQAIFDISGGHHFSWPRILNWT